jgi:hypothetical protein
MGWMLKLRGAGAIFFHLKKIIPGLFQEISDRFSALSRLKGKTFQ